MRAAVASVCLWPSRFRAPCSCRPIALHGPAWPLLGTAGCAGSVEFHAHPCCILTNLTTSNKTIFQLPKILFILEHILKSNMSNIKTRKGNPQQATPQTPYFYHFWGVGWGKQGGRRGKVPWPKPHLSSKRKEERERKAELCSKTRAALDHTCIRGRSCFPAAKV